MTTGGADTHTAQQIVGGAMLDNPRTDRVNEVVLVITIVLVVLAIINATPLSRRQRF